MARKVTFDDPVNLSLSIDAENAPLLKPAKAGTIQNYSSGSRDNSPEPTVTVIRTYWWRWIMLFIFFLNPVTTNLIWIPSASIADVVSCYYDISLFWVNALSEVYMLTYIILVFPVAWMLDKYGMRFTVVNAACFNAAGVALKLAGTDQRYFWLSMFGQTLGSISCVFVWTSAPFLAEVWFSARERATATAFAAAIAPQLGTLIGLGLPPLIVDSGDQDLQFDVCGNVTSNITASPEERLEWSEFVYYRLLYFNTGVAAFGFITFLLVLFGFRNTPPTPPSVSRKLEGDHRQSSGCQQLKEFVLSTLKAFKNYYYLMYMIVMAIIIGVAGAVTAVINEIVHPYFPDYDEQIGYLGISSQAASILAMFVAGRVLDWTKAFYAVNLVVCLLSLLCTIAWAVLILFQNNFYLLYIPSILLGVSMVSVHAVAYEYAFEMTYPLPEGISAGLINVSSQVVSLGVLMLVGYFADPHVHNVPVGLWSMVGLVALACLITVFVRPELRRVKLDRKS